MALRTPIRRGRLQSFRRAGGPAGNSPVRQGRGATGREDRSGGRQDRYIAAGHVSALRACGTILGSHDDPNLTIGATTCRGSGPRGFLTVALSLAWGAADNSRVRRGSKRPLGTRLGNKSLAFSILRRYSP